MLSPALSSEPVMIALASSSRASSCSSTEQHLLYSLSSSLTCRPPWRGSPFFPLAHPSPSGVLSAGSSSLAATIPVFASSPLLKRFSLPSSPVPTPVVSPPSLGCLISPRRRRHPRRPHPTSPLVPWTALPESTPFLPSMLLPCLRMTWHLPPSCPFTIIPLPSLPLLRARRAHISSRPLGIRLWRSSR